MVLALTCSARLAHAAPPAASEKPLPNGTLPAGTASFEPGPPDMAGLEMHPDCVVDAGCCASGCGGGKVIGGAGLYLMQPFFTSNPGISFFRQGTGPGQRDDISQHMGVAPLVWLGYMLDGGLGARARWWYFRQGTDQTYSFGPPNGGTLTVLSAAPLGSAIIQNNPVAFNITSKLQLQVADLEAVQEVAFHNWNFLFSGGLGYADITQSYNAFAFNFERLPLLSGRSFVGVGPELALEARRQIMSSGLNLYGSARTRVLFGSAKQLVSGGDELHGSQQTHQDEVLAVEELEVGFEYGVTFGRSRWFGQLAMVGQEWLGAGNATGTARSGPPTTIPNFSTEDHSNLGFFGVSFRLGVNF